MYRNRSPIHHPDRITGKVLLLQGEDDPVVPVSQSLRFAERLRAQGVDCTQTIFVGESHGFRQAATIETCLVEELEFYRGLFGEVGAGC
jgi:dipeptidyl aminopeptidase/acylaminoacyl peptidase